MSFRVRQDTEQVYQPMPYEIAHGIARSTAKHCFNFQKLRREANKLLEQDPSSSKAKTKKAVEELEKMKSCFLYIVFNRRTGQVASSEWLRQHITVGEDGKPRPARSNSRANPWITTLKFELVENEVRLSFRALETQEFRSVRCFCFHEGRAFMKLHNMRVAYDHVVTAEGPTNDEEEDQQQDLPAFCFVDMEAW